ncbi:MAG: UDP-N-acetylmuramoyl-tripeptide--D-alanyl-D-alanine ligase [bacterium]
MDLTVREFLSIKHCSFGFHGNPGILDEAVSGISIDSRKVSAGEIFFAIRGETHDGHDFIGAAFENNAQAAVVCKSWWTNCPAHLESNNFFVVEDTLAALQEAAHFYRGKFTLPVLALTGTNGKTTTKEMVATVLGQKHTVCKTRGNLNNHIGLPLSLFALDQQQEVAILEMGCNHFGEIARLCEIAEPQFGLITNVGHGHLEFFADLEGVAKAKAELFENLHPPGTAFINLDDPLISKYVPANLKSVTYGFKEEARVSGEVSGADEHGCFAFRVEKTPIRLNVPGKHNLSNALAAVAVGLEFGVSLSKIKQALENVALPGQRMEMFERNKVRIINDSYNANPDSTRASLSVLKQTQSTGKKIFVFADMLELGERATLEHAEIGKALKDYRVDVVLAFGEYAEAAVAAARKASKKIVAKHFSEKTALVKALKEQIKAGDVLLVKGSRGMKMEEVLQKLFAESKMP